MSTITTQDALKKHRRPHKGIKPATAMKHVPEGITPTAVCPTCKGKGSVPNPKDLVPPNHSMQARVLKRG